MYTADGRGCPQGSPAAGPKYSLKVLVRLIGLGPGARMSPMRLSSPESSMTDAAHQFVSASLSSIQMRSRYQRPVSQAYGIVQVMPSPSPPNGRHAAPSTVDARESVAFQIENRTRRLPSPPCCSPI